MFMSARFSLLGVWPTPAYRCLVLTTWWGAASVVPSTRSFRGNWLDNAVQSLGGNAAAYMDAAGQADFRSSRARLSEEPIEGYGRPPRHATSRSSVPLA